MSIDANETALINLSNADRAAKAQPHLDINSPLAACAASQDKIFVVPVRYALAEQAASHPSCQPGVQPKSHSMAARRLRTGFLYLWQGTGPLQRYGVCAEGKLDPEALDDDDTRLQRGTQTGIALSKHQPAWLMYTEYPLDMPRCQELAQPAIRQKRMRQIDLPEVANQLQADHCPPLEATEQVIAELMPETYHWGVVSDHQRNGETERQQAYDLREKMLENPTPETLQAYTDALYWVGERDYVMSKHAGAAKDRPPPGDWSAHDWHALRTRGWLQSAKQEAQGLWAVFACLDDDLGVLRDIDHEQDHLEISHQQWIGENQIRLTVGGFVRSLLTEDGAEVANLVNYRYVERNLGLTPEQGEVLLDINAQAEPLRFEEARLANAQTVQMTTEGKQQLANIREQIRQLQLPMAKFLPVELHKDVDKEVRRYRKQKDYNQRKGKFSGRIDENIDLPAMNNWLDETAPAHYQRVKERHELLYADRGIFLARHDSGTWFVNYDDAHHREWLDDLAEGCLTAQCLYNQGAEQYAGYVRSKDPGALRQLFFSWSPSLEAALNSETRLGEIMAALSDENLSNTQAALSKALGEAANPVLAHMRVMADDSRWVTMVNRLSPAVLLLRSKLDRLSESWVGMMVFARTNAQIGFKWSKDQNFMVFEAFGKGIKELEQWARSTAFAISKGNTANILNSKVVQNSGGLTPLLVLVLNTWNASRYVNDASIVERMGEQRTYDVISAVLYTAAALMAVVDNVVRKGYGLSEYRALSRQMPIAPLFGGIIGLLSFEAARYEFKSIQEQIESSHNSVDPWLKLRKNIVGGQMAVYAAQAAAGFGFTMAAITGVITPSAAIAGFTIVMAYLFWVIAFMGGLYLVAWFFQKTPLQNFLHHCCWSRQKAGDLSPITLSAQKDEMDELLVLLYSPRVNFKEKSEKPDSGKILYLQDEHYVEAVSIDLPGALPNSVRLDISLIGDPIDYELWMERRRKPGLHTPPYLIRDMGTHWLENSHCEWIPPDEGQGLRITGVFKKVAYKLASLPQNVSIRVKYSSPLTSLLQINRFIGGEEGLSFTLTPKGGVIPLRNDETLILNNVIEHRLGEQQCSKFLQPKAKK
ncbi:hypothetical protein PS3A_48990 [Pseudomonas sp. 3A(2025)]